MKERDPFQEDAVGLLRVEEEQVLPAPTVLQQRQGRDVVVFLSWAAELHLNRSLPAPPQRERGENRMERAQGLREGQGDHSTMIVTGKRGSAEPVPVQPGPAPAGALHRPRPPPGHIHLLHRGLLHGLQRGDLLRVGPVGCRGTACSTRGLSPGRRGTAAVSLEHLLPPAALTLGAAERFLTPP